MKILLVLCFFAIVFSCPTHASGLGWGVQSLDWKKYESDKIQIDTSVKKCIDLGGEEWKWCGERKIVSMFIGTREQVPDSLEKYSVKNVIPQGLEYITIDVVHEAYDIQAKHNPSTLFGLFKSGRSEWKGQWVGCSAYPDMAWDCTNSYVLMRPQEVQALKQEVDSLIKKKPKTQYEYFQQDLDALKLIADAAVKQGRALIFYVSD